MAKNGSSGTPATTRVYGVTDWSGKERLIEAASNAQAVMFVYGPKVRLVPAIEAVKASRGGAEIEDATKDDKQQPLAGVPAATPQNAAGAPQDFEAPKADEGSAQSEKPSQPAAPAADAGKAAAGKPAGSTKGAK